MSRSWLACALAAGCILLPLRGHADPEAARTRAHMQELVRALQTLLPLSLEEGGFSDPAQRETIGQALSKLAAASAGLEDHGAGSEIAFSHLSRSLAADAAEIDRRFRAGRVEEAQFLTSELSDRCIACHTRLPGRGDSPLGSMLYARLPEDLDPDTQLRFLTATRQFDRALDLAERRMAEPTLPRIDLELLLLDYLVIAIRVEGELERAAKTLGRLRQQRELPIYLDRRLQVWGRALSELSLDVAPGSRIKRAREIQAEAAPLRRFPADREALVHDLVTSSLIHRALEEPGLSANERAEAYYALGLAEIHAEVGAWLAEPEAYLEAAVRAAPGSPLAAQSYALLEEFTLAGFTGSDGTSLPPEVRSWLTELRTLAEPKPAATGEEG